jgi:hypothetical protein
LNHATGPSEVSSPTTMGSDESGEADAVLAVARDLARAFQ